MTVAFESSLTGDAFYFGNRCATAYSEDHVHGLSCDRDGVPMNQLALVPLLCAIILNLRSCVSKPAGRFWAWLQTLKRTCPEIGCRIVVLRKQSTWSYSRRSVLVAATWRVLQEHGMRVIRAYDFDVLGTADAWEPASSCGQAGVKFSMLMSATLAQWRFDGQSG